MVSGLLIPSQHMSTTLTSSDALRQERRRWSFLRSHKFLLWPLGHLDPVQCCSALRTPTLSSSFRWSLTMMMQFDGQLQPIPTCRQYISIFYQGVTVCLDAMRKAFPATDSLQRTTKFFYSPTFRQSEAGIPIGPNSSTPASSRHMLNLYTTPAPAFEVWDTQMRILVCAYFVFRI